MTAAVHQTRKAAPQVRPAAVHTPGARRATPAPILAIASGKGGVGKTWLSATLAAAYGRAGRRALLVDCDVGLANVDVQLGVRPEHDLAAVMQGWLELDQAVTPIAGGPGRRGGFDLLPGHSGSGALAALKPEEVHQIALGIRRLAPAYDVVILDLAAGVDQTVMRFARAADRVCVVTNEEPTALTDAYAFMKLMRMQMAQVEPWVLVNCVETRPKGRRVYDQFAMACQEYLGFKPKFAGIVHRDPRVADSIRAQTLLPQRHPQAQAFEDVLRVAEALLEP